MKGVAAVRVALPSIVSAAGAMVERLRRSEGRLVYVGAGTSGQLALQDGMEMTSTFGWPPERLLFLIAGGDEARLRPRGIWEDDTQAAHRAVTDNKIGTADTVVGVAASGATPFTVSLFQRATSAGALTVGIVNSPGAPMLRASTHPILLDTGAEVIAGSTRLKAGTAQKTVLGMLSSLVMMRLGHVVDGFMVSLVADNEKLQARAVRMVAEIAGVGLEEAARSSSQTEGRVKEAVLVAQGVAVEQARDTLAARSGNLRVAMTDLDLKN